MEAAMGALSRKQKDHLTDLFGTRVSFNKTERLLYSHDIAAMPPVAKLLIGNTVPDAIIQPNSSAEVELIVQWAYDNGIPVTPRGKGSSGYGGTIPVNNGIVIDFFRMNTIISMDDSSNTVTVQPGITWEQLDREIHKHGLTLRTYPTSYPSSSVGGWLAQGGAGLGSYEYGYFKDNVVSADVVLPAGDTRTFSGQDLDLIADAEGITGIITEVTVRIQPLEELDIIAIACPDAHQLTLLVESIIEAQLPIWSMVFINPRMAEMKNRSPLMEHFGHPVEERVILPAAYIMTLAVRKQDGNAVRDALTTLVKPCQGEILTDRIAQHEWEHRFKLMVVKRLGPSLVPAEVIVPLGSLGDVMAEIEQKVDQPVVKEGVIIKNGSNGRPEAVILGFIPSDQRKFSYNMVFGLVITILKIAEQHGGRPYSTGLYFTKKAESVLGTERVTALKKYKTSIDPKGLLNPGKVLGGGPLSFMLDFARFFEPLIRPFGNSVLTRVGERPTKPVRGIPSDVAWYAYSCSQCGYCIDQCDQFYGRGWESQSPRGKWFWLREYMEGRTDWDQFMVDSIIACTTCELCNHRCSAALPIEPSWMKLRGQLIQDQNRMTFPPFEMMAAALHDQGNIWAGYRKNRHEWFPEDLIAEHGPGKQSKYVYFAGCTASYVEHDIGIASVRLLHDAHVDFTSLGQKENCCGTPMLVAGKWNLFAETMKKNIAAVKAAGADTVISSCPACDMMWRHVYPEWSRKLGVDYDITARHYSEVLSEKIRSGEFTFPDRGREPITVTWHDSCHIGRVSGVYEPPRDIIKAIPGMNFVEMEFNHEKAHCCGSVLTLIKEPDVAAEIGKERLEEAVDAGASKVGALCPCCEFQLRVSADTKQMPVEVVDLARMAAEARGYELPDPHPEVRRQWAVFEAMIALMTPKGFADLMSSMLPELVDAMPMGMGGMMRFMGRLPGALTLMKPMFPFLFPRLLPSMMPTLMPVILDRVSQRIPMPDYMEKQMPDMMPKVMSNLMPHMLPDVVPLVSKPLIQYLQGK
jgi:Fe-S oxidoreductase/FAD/FMN-containing dehydrogenase